MQFLIVKGKQQINSVNHNEKSMENEVGIERPTDGKTAIKIIHFLPVPLVGNLFNIRSFDPLMQIATLRSDLPEWAKGYNFNYFDQ